MVMRVVVMETVLEAKIEFEFALELELEHSPDVQRNWPARDFYHVAMTKGSQSARVEVPIQVSRGRPSLLDALDLLDINIDIIIFIRTPYSCLTRDAVHSLGGYQNLGSRERPADNGRH
jgi:hypothetical protein